MEISVKMPSTLIEPPCDACPDNTVMIDPSLRCKNNVTRWVQISLDLEN